MTFEVQVDRYQIKEEHYGKNLTFYAEFNDHFKTSDPFEFTLYINEVVIQEEPIITPSVLEGNEEDSNSEEEAALAQLAELGITFEDLESVETENSTNTFKGVEIKKISKEKVPEPSISVLRISPLGEITIKFNQEFVVPKNW